MRAATAERDLLDDIMADSEAEHPGFGAEVADALRRRMMGRALSDRRKALGISQAEIARRMRTSQPAVSRLEAGDDVRLSTLTRYLDAVGVPADWPERLAAAK